MRTARNKYSFGFCDRTGFRYPLTDLVDEYKNGVKTGLRVGRDVADDDHPQNFLGRVRIFDPQSLANARPDTALAASRQLFGFDPVWNSAQFMTASVGRVTVSFDESLVAPAGVSATGTVGAASALIFTANPVAPSQAVGGVGTVTITGDLVTTVPVTGSTAVGGVGVATSSVNVTQSFAITVAAASGYGGGNKFYVDGVEAPTGTINEGSTYLFDQSHSSNSGHPLRFSTTSDGTHAGGVEYTTGVTYNGTPGNAGAYTQIVVAVGAPTLYYYCPNHSGMGGQANTP
tara:strand:- start:1117 stop:1980 length:864 start_codon:yes stop_codon:yes gene_type:complete